jgi:glycosyltransferase involved in cell wall biosynthesis
MKTILYHSNNSRAFTGFGKHCKNILKYLHKTGKYNVIEFCNGSAWNDPSHQLKPWKCQGSLPNNPRLLNQINADPTKARAAGYGAETIDKAIKKYKPDIYIGVEDIWAFGGFWDKPWWDKINHMIWTTLDSQPILPQALEAAPKTKNFFGWASFAERDMKKEGFDHVKTLHGSVETKDFYKLSETQKFQLRKKFSIPQDEFIIGFVFRNQLRKSVPNILDGFKMFKKDCPQAKLLLHTHWSEGWDIPRLLKEKDINFGDIYTTYFCKACNEYEIKPFHGQEQTCSSCGSEKTLNTTNVAAGVNEEQLNEIYNLMDVYCHPFTSGGMEIPIFEAKLTELITLVTNYSCGEDSCTVESGGLPLDWAEYREPGTQFIKASTYPSSIAKQLKKVWQMKPEKRKELGKKARKFTIDNYSVDVIGKKLEDLLDNMPDVDYDYNFDSQSTGQDMDDFLDPGDRIAVVMPGSAIDVIYVNSLISNLKNNYPNHDIYFFTNPDFFDYIECHENIHKVLPYAPEIDDPTFLEGAGIHKGYFDMAFFPHYSTQRNGGYIHNGKDKSQFKLCHT